MRPRPTLLALLLALTAAVSAHAVVPDAVPDLPVLGPETPRGSIATAPGTATAPQAKVVDGDVADWTGSPTRLGGTAIYSAGEYVYQDFLTDDRGADDGGDAARLAKIDPLRELEPRTYRLDSLGQAAGDEFGVEGPLSGQTDYGDAEEPEDLAHHADIVEARAAADGERLLFLVRTAGMTADPGTAVLVLLDTEAGGSYPAPGGLRTSAEWAFVAAGSSMRSVTYRGVPVSVVCGPPCTSSPWEVATNAAGFANAVEIAIRRSFIPSLPGVVKVGLATALVGDTPSGIGKVRTGDAASDLINVAFRFDEPVRVRMDREQALALRLGKIDRYLAPVDLSKMTAGYTERFTLRPGYFDRIYVSSSPVVREEHSGGEYQGIFQHYGLYIPTGYRPAALNPAMVWLHSRSSAGTHLAGAWVPGIIRQLGEQRDAVVITPSARGSSTWYVGKGHEDFLEAWNDAMASVRIDPDRVTLSGHSMGGFGSFLLGFLYPDRFAAAFPISPPITQGGWLGVGEPIAPQNDGDVEAEFLYNVIENARNIPFVLYEGTFDELVFATGVARVALRFAELGYRHRLYLFPGQDHYAPLIVDEWKAAGRYLDSFRRDPNPARVTYRVWPALERAVETISMPEGATLDYAFDGAYWVDGLAVRSGNPQNPATMGTIDATSFARGVPAVLGVPEAGVAALGQSSPFVMTGLAWLETGREAARNAFAVTLDNIATASLDVARMALDTAKPIVGTISSDGAVVLRLAGTWASPPTVTGATSSSYSGGILTIEVAAGSRAIRITP
jgi:pimeloyl-ACP methyl ester carboxylesterase